MKYFHIIIALCTIIAGACSSKFGDEKTYLTNVISSSEVTDYKYVLIIPGVGCNGCIQESEFFLKQNIDNQKILFILTNPSSIKTLQHKIGVKISDKKNIIIDRDGKFKVPTKNSIYPCVIYLDDGAIIDIEFQTPQTSALHSLYDKSRS